MTFVEINGIAIVARWEQGLRGLRRSRTPIFADVSSPLIWRSYFGRLLACPAACGAITITDDDPPRCRGCGEVMVTEQKADREG